MCESKSGSNIEQQIKNHETKKKFIGLKRFPRSVFLLASNHVYIASFQEELMNEFQLSSLVKKMTNIKALQTSFIEIVLLSFASIIVSAFNLYVSASNIVPREEDSKEYILTNTHNI